MNTKINITIQKSNNEDPLILQCAEGTNLLEAMNAQGINYPADCGGRGTCGKCKIQVIAGTLDITEQDIRIFTEKELEEGFRLSCNAYPRQDCTISLLSEVETDYVAITDYKINRAQAKDQVNLAEQTKSVDHRYIMAIDLGTTTIAFSLVDATDKQMVKTHTMVNRQKAYGADVISRIKASNEGKSQLLRDIILEELYQGFQTIIDEAEIQPEEVLGIAIAGNTTMGHLLLGYSCETLGVYPFVPVNIGTVRLNFEELFKERYQIPIIVLPGISAFVGGDITAGLLACGFDYAEKPCLFIDLGTNGEMALGNKDRILVASTAAGPAFEGGNISSGVGSLPGAISHVTISADKPIYETIGGKPPIGICGTGLIDIVSELFKAGLMDDTGLLVEAHFEKGYTIEGITLTQRDIRELQLAKAAIHAGIEILIKQYGTTYQQIDKVYLAGGFGYKMDIAKAVHIGLIPEELVEKIEAVGNTSLAGAIQYLTDTNSVESIEHILSVSEEINLSNDSDFNDIYVSRMSFDHK
ncbi:MAG TPA: ASKHA domain-containing protein [Mobilitalea sp.]|nr:ASKHA domain-containing protein [Mobilitalea sp.]